MNKQRGIFIIGGSMALLVSAVTLTLWMRKQKAAQVAEDALNEEMVEHYEEYVKAESAPKPKPRRAAHPKNGKVVKA